MVSEKIIVELELRVKQARQALEQYNKKVANMTKVGGTQFNAYEKRLDAVTAAQQKLAKLSGVTQQKFAGWAMSIMFFGMALQRVFGQVWKFGTKTFSDVMHSVEGTTTNFDLLQGSMKYLGFSVGEALEPMIALLIPIIDKITDWVQANPELVAGITKIGIVLGAIFTAGGAGVLALNGFRELTGIMKAIPSTANELKAFDWKGLGDSIYKGLGLSAIAFGISFFIDGYKDMKQGEWLDGLLGMAGGAFTTLGGLKMVKGTDGGWLIALGVSLELLQENKFFTSIYSVAGLVIALFLSIRDYIAWAFEDGTRSGLVKMAKQLLDSPILEAITKIFGVTQTSLFDAIKLADIPEFDFGESFKKNYASALKVGNTLDENLERWKQEVQSLNAPTVEETMKAGKSYLTPQQQLELSEKDKSALELFSQMRNPNVNVTVVLDDKVVSNAVLQQIVGQI